MSLWKIAWRSIEQRSLASSLTAFSMALGVALVITVVVMYGALRATFDRSAKGYEIIVGSVKEGRLELVLNSVFHLGSFTGNIPWSYYKEFTPGGKYASQIQTAIPICMGDNYEGYRVVGTVPHLFEIEYVEGQKYAFAAGENFEHEHFFDAVIGSVVARKTGLTVGSKFQPTHGLTDAGHKHEAFEVVGILAPTGTPDDKALFINIEGFYLLENHAKPLEKGAKKAHDGDDDDHKHDAKPDAKTGEQHKDVVAAAENKTEAASKKPAEKDHADSDHKHAHEEKHAHKHEHDEHGHEHHDPLPEEQRELSAILIRTSNPMASVYLPEKINREPFAQAVFPAREIYKLFDGILGPMELILLILAIVIVVVAGVGIMVSIYNSMSERRREIAIMRSLGAGRQTVLAIVLLESILLSLGGGGLGFLLGHGLIGVLNPLILAQTGVSIGWLQFDPYELVLIPGLVVLASLAGFLPAQAAYRTDVAKALSAAP